MRSFIRQARLNRHAHPTRLCIPRTGRSCLIMEIQQSKHSWTPRMVENTLTPTAMLRLRILKE